MGYQEDIFERASALGVDKPLASARELQALTERLGQELVSLRGAEEKRRHELVQLVAEGKLAPADIPAKLTFDWVLDSPASMVLVHANVGLHANATRLAREAAPKIFEALQHKVQSIVDESVKQSVALPRGVDSEQKALRARNGDRKALDTWERLRALVDDWVAVHTLVDLMWKASWIPGPEHPHDRPEARLYTRYEAPLRLPAGYWQQTPAELRLGVAKASGAGPALIDWGTAAARFERVDRRQRNYISAQVVTRRDGLGNIVSEERSPETAAEYMPSRR
jgi:hypothetical protein